MPPAPNSNDVVSGQRAPTALITGAGSGIGRSTAIMLASGGWSLALVGRTRARLEETANLCKRHQSSARILDIDLGFESTSARIIDWVFSEFGRLDALVNNAGIGELHPIAETTRELLEKTFAVNTFAPALLIAHAWPLFERRMLEQPGDRAPAIVNVTSIATHDPFPGLSAYAASKAAWESYVRSIRNEASLSLIRAFAIAPGAVETPLLRSVFDEGAMPKERTLHPDEVARVIVDCVLGRRDEDAGRTIVVPSR